MPRHAAYATVHPESPTASFSSRPAFSQPDSPGPSQQDSPEMVFGDRPPRDARSPPPFENTPVNHFTTDVCVAVAGDIQHKVEESEHSGEPIIRIDDDMYIAAQIRDSSLADIKDLGIRTIFNIRQQHEKGFMSFEKQAKSANLTYQHFPVAYDGWDTAQVDKLLANLDRSEKPCLVFCEMGLRAAAVAVAFKESRRAVRDVLDGRRDSEAPLMNDTELSIFDNMENIKPGHTFQYKGFVNSYIQTKIENALQRPGQQKITDDFYIGGQVSEAELHKAKDAGVKAVLNLRCAAEAGQFGLGVLAREEQIVHDMGLKYVQIPVPDHGPYSDELRSRVVRELTALIESHKPVLVHCRTGQRIREILQGTSLAVRSESHDLTVKINDYVEPSDVAYTWKDILRTVLVSIVMGLAFGAAMERGKVTLPVVIRQQFLFERFIMLKMFLSAAASSAFWLAVLSLAAPTLFERARTEYMGCGKGKGLIGVAFGAAVLGAGMAIAGSCPGMVLVQVGSGVENSGVTVAGGLAAAALYGMTQPYIVPWLTGGMVCQVKAEDFKKLAGFKFYQLALPLAAGMAGLIVLIEILAPWTASRELPAFAEPWTDSWPPILSGFIIGSLQIPAVIWLGDTLGSSSSYMTFTSQLLGLSSSLQSKFKHWAGFRNGLGNWWQLIYIFAAIGGAYLSAATGVGLGKPQGVSIADAFIGGFLIIFGSRIASGCTSGHGLSGMALLSVHSMVATPAMFAGGIVVAFCYNAADSGYIFN